MKAINLSLKDHELYTACPYCFAEITAQSQPQVQTNTETSTAVQTQTAVEAERPESTATHCTRHFGYLGERSSKERIPEECITCAEILSCMLKK